MLNSDDELKYSDCPTVSETLSIAASAAAVWKLVSDITLPLNFSSEIQSVGWVDGVAGLELGAEFEGQSAHKAIGEWSTTSVISQLDEGRVFEWSVSGEGVDASAIWRYTITPTGENSVELEHWFQMGPARSGLSMAIDQMPDKEAKIISRRLQEHRTNMVRVLDGIKQLAEQGGGLS